MRAIDTWWAIHPHLVELILFCVSVFVALFPERSRRWVIMPLTYSATGALRFMQRDAKNTLKIMRLIDRSAFKLVAYIAFYCINAIFWSFGTSAIFFICLNLLSYWRTGHPNFFPFNVLFFGALFGRAVRFYFFLNSLLHWEESIKQLEKIAANDPLE